MAAGSVRNNISDWRDTEDMPTVGRLVSRTGRFSDSVKIVTVSRITVRYELVSD